MKTTSKIFVGFFAGIGVFSACAANSGVRHQWVIAAICAMMVIALLADVNRKDKGQVNPGDIVS